MSAISVLQGFLSFLIARTPFVVFVVLSSLSAGTPPPGSTGPSVANSIPRIMISPAEDLEEDYVVINITPSNDFLSPYLCPDRISLGERRAPKSVAIPSNTNGAAKRCSIAYRANTPETISVSSSIITADEGGAEGIVAHDAADTAHFTARPKMFITFHADLSLKTMRFFLDSDAQDDVIGDVYEHNYDDDEPLGDVIECFSQIPVVQVYGHLQEDAASKYAPERFQVNDINNFSNLKIESPTRAFGDVQSRSHKIRRVPRAPVFSNVSAHKQHNHPKRPSRYDLPALKDFGRSSRLQRNYNLGNFEEEIERRVAPLQRFCDE